MKSLLVKIACFAVMFHMTFGCNMHHGLGTSTCANQGAIACHHNHGTNDGDDSGHNHEHDDHDQQTPVSGSTCDELGKSHGPSHLACCDDGCNATQFVKFKFQALDFSVPYLGGVDTFALIENQSITGLDVDPFPDCSHSETGVRAHLLFGVQIL